MRECPWAGFPLVLGVVLEIGALAELLIFNDYYAALAAFIMGVYSLVKGAEIRCKYS